MAMTPEKMYQSVLKNLPKHTGKNLEEWKKICVQNGPSNQKLLANWLKDTHGLGGNQAKFVAMEVFGQSKIYESSDDELIELQYSRGKEHFKTLYFTIIETISSWPEVVVSARKTYVSIIRNRQFLILKPATKNRFEIGLALPDPPNNPLLSSHGILVDGRITRQINLEKDAEVPDELIALIKMAYEADE